MSRFACIAIDPTIAERFRATGIDDRGNPVKRMTATADGGFPCRVCLTYARPGEEMLLGSYNLPKPLGLYWTPSPIFVHAEPCTPYDGADEVVDIVRNNALVSVRAYDAGGMMVDADLADGTAVEVLCEKLLARADIAYLHVHNAKPGCYAARVERA